jgi:hypothetical protein
MNISILFEELEKEELRGELMLEGNCIIWSYNLNDDSEEIDIAEVNDDDDYGYDITSPLELLQDAYNEDLGVIELSISEFDEQGDWTFSDPEIGETTISFKIF